LFADIAEALQRRCKGIASALLGLGFDSKKATVSVLLEIPSERDTYKRRLRLQQQF
jgi:hypothetical protein